MGEIEFFCSVIIAAASSDGCVYSITIFYADRSLSGGEFFALLFINVSFFLRARAINVSKHQRLHSFEVIFLHKSSAATLFPNTSSNFFFAVDGWVAWTWTMCYSESGKIYWDGAWNGLTILIAVGWTSDNLFRLKLRLMEVNASHKIPLDLSPFSLSKIAPRSIQISLASSEIIHQFISSRFKLIHTKT